MSAERRWLERFAVARHEAGEPYERIEASFAEQIGSRVIWRGFDAEYAESIRHALNAVRQRCGFPTMTPTEPTK